MGVFIARRVIVSFFTLLASTFLVYALVANAGDPTAEFILLPDAEQRENAIAAVTERLQLDEPVAQRYLGWLAGSAGCLVGACDLGLNRDGQEVTVLLGQAMASTLRLVTVATLLAIVFGVIIGIISALRQYSGFDYAMTFLAFLFFSLPIFWVAVLLKDFGAIRVNDWLEDPVISWPVILTLTVVSALMWQAILGGSRRRRLIVAGISAAATAATLGYLSAVEWFTNPALGPFLVIVSAVAWAFGITFLVAGLRARGVLYASLVAAAAAIVGWFALDPVLQDPSWGILGLCALGLAAVGVVAGYLLGGLDKPQAMRAAVATGLLSGGTVFLDYLLRAVPTYSDAVNGRIVATIGSGTPNFSGTFWEVTLDQVTALILPTAALILITFATYVRFTRGTMLEVMGMDYVRTARAKGLTERTVTTRHAFRNALIPVTTLSALALGNIISGAIITETVFGWSGMGRLFIEGLNNVDPNPVMAFYLVTAVAIILFNLLADITYAYLDPRIRLS